MINRFPDFKEPVTVSSTIEALVHSTRVALQRLRDQNVVSQADYEATRFAADTLAATLESARLEIDFVIAEIKSRHEQSKR